MDLKKTATAVWTGDVKAGGGTLSTQSSALRDAPYTYKSRFEGGAATNPEELIAAAHAGCFSMALSLMLGKQDRTPERIETQAEVTLDPDALEITQVNLVVRATVPGIDQATFASIADEAKAGCPVSKLLKARITLDANLET
ncbi:MAG TPA: OsmC family protein [Rhodanobacteraceae bacterium]|nr:OsmC family protein [Rhodanobacteraceae bacterium]